MNTDPGSIFNGFVVELWPSLAVEFWSRCWILTPSWVAIPRVEDIYAGQNSTLNCDPGSKIHVEVWPRVRIPHWIVIQIPGQNLSWGHNPTWNKDPGSHFNVESWPGVIIQRGILNRVTIQRGIMTWGHNSTLSYDPGSQFNVELLPRVKISRWVMTRVIVPNWIVIQFQGQYWTLNHVSGSQFNVELRPGVIIQRGIKTRGHSSTGGSKFYPSRGRYTMTPCLRGSQFNMKKPLNPDHSLLN